ncbi:metal ABC transporter substrate-binding protein [bacterium]|nr:metal ABC transporter substrate-binding protein [bacterium]
MFLSSPRAEQPTFAGSIGPVAAILDELTTPRTRVECILPAGASPHTYAARPSDVRKIARGTLFWVAPQLDGWAARLPAARKIELLPLIPKEYLLGWEGLHDAHDHDAHDAHDHASDIDPHFWTDPLAVKALLPALAARLSEIDPAGASLYQSNARAMARRLDDLDRELAKLLAPVRGRPVVLFHPSFRYLMRRYGLPLAGVIEPAPGKEPGPRTIMELVNKVHAAKARALFTEPQLPRRVAQAVAEAAGVPLYELNPLGNSADIESLIRSNAIVLRKALQ